MISIPRNRSAAAAAAADWDVEKDGKPNMDMITIPIHFRCPISLDLMKDPVTLSTGITYDRDSIEKWIQEGNNKCPITNQPLTNTDHLIPNHTLRKMLQDWCVENYCYGIQRIPTPRIPVTPIDVKEILTRFTIATRRSDQFRSCTLLEKIKSLFKESDRNTKCFISNGTANVLAAGFHAFASIYNHDDSNLELLLTEILALLIWMFPLDTEALSFLGSSSSLHCMLRFLETGDLSRRKNAVLILKDLLSSDQQYVDSLAKIDQVDVLLLKLIKQPISQSATKASLIIVSNLINSSHKIASSLVDLGLISLLIEILVDSERNISENVLSVLDGVCEHHQGRTKALDHALTVPVLVKKLLRVSSLANSLSVSILWKLCNDLRRQETGTGALVDALQMSVFQKLLLLLQVGCDEITKEKVTKLLKLFNPHRGTAECLAPFRF